MNTANPTLLQTSPGYEVTYKKGNPLMLVMWCIWVLLSILNIWKIYKHGRAFETLDIVWPICLILYPFAIINLVLSRTTFRVHNGQLTFIDRSLFNKNIKMYETSRMEQLEVEQLLLKKYPFIKEKATGKYEVTFLYYNETRRLSASLTYDEAQELLNAILSEKAGS